MDINKVIETLFKSEDMIPVASIMMILGGVINTSKPDDEEIKKLCEIFNKTDLSQEEIISHTVMMTCNSIAMSINNYLNKPSNKVLDA